MEQQDQQNGLYHKVRLGKAEGQARGVSLARALRLTLAKVGEERFDLALAVLGVTSKSRSNDEIAAMMEGAKLLMLLDGPGGARGGVVIDETLVTGLIQQQTMGKVVAPNTETPRKMTTTDAAIFAPLVNELLPRAAKLPDAPAEQLLLQGYQFGASVGDSRLMLMALEAARYTVIEITVDMAAGARQGKLVLIMPAVPERAPAEKSDGTDAGQTPRRPPMEETVMGLNADLPVFLTSLTLPLDEVRDFKVDQVLSLGHADFSDVSIVTCKGRVLAKGNLGKCKDQRAVRLTTRKSVTATPKRRASDRPNLDLPALESTGVSDYSRVADKVSFEGVMTSDAKLPEMLEPTASEESAKITAKTVPALSDIPDLGDLPDLPDMSDLPDFADLPEAS